MKRWCRWNLHSLCGFIAEWFDIQEHQCTCSCHQWGN